MIRVPYVDLAAPHRELRDELARAAGRVLESGCYIGGGEVELLEQRLAELCGSRHAVAVASGTDAIMLALRALGVGAGDEVVTVAHTFVATVSAVVLTGARPVFVDVADDFNMDPDQVAAAITDRTRAILPVHLTGRPAQVRRLLELADRFRLPLVEDCAQAIGARYEGRSVGSFGAAGCFSLHPLKNLGACGDAGFITTQDDARAARLRLARNHGLSGRDRCDFFSVNSRLDPLQAALLRTKLDHLSRWNEQRRRRAGRYRESLRDVVGVPEERCGELAVYHTFVVTTPRRDALARYLSGHGIETRVHYPVPVHLQPAARGLGYHEGALPRTEALARTILSLPIFPELTDEQQDAVIDGVRGFFRT